MPVNDMQYNLRQQEIKRANVMNQLGTNSRMTSLRDDPFAAAHAVRYDSYLARLNRFEANTQKAIHHYNNVHDHLYSTNDILQRLRDLALNGANGTNSPDDLKIMALEVNQLISELVSISNAFSPETKQIFAGDKVHTEPFRVVEGRVDGGDETMITRVEYRGSGATRRIEIGDNMFLDMDLGGGEAFWAEKMQIFSSVDATDYRVQEPGAFFIDGVEINVAVGDTLPAIVAKINDSGAPVRAYIDIDTRGLVLEGTTAHLIRAEDKVGGASILRDLGIIHGNMVNNAPNWATTARVSGGTIFDMAIRLRDGLLRGDHDFIGSQGIAGIDLAINNVTYRLADISGRASRAEIAWTRINSQIPNVTRMLNREIGLDVATAATELKQAEFAHQSILATAAKLLPPSLLNFLR